jgi:hypothetical protein
MSVIRPITVLLAVLLCGGGALVTVEAARPSHTPPPPAPPLPAPLTAADAMTSPTTSPTTTAHTPIWVDEGGWESFSGWVDCQNGGAADGDCAM